MHHQQLGTCAPQLPLPRYFGDMSRLRHQNISTSPICKSAVLRTEYKSVPEGMSRPYGPESKHCWVHDMGHQAQQPYQLTF